MQTGKALLRLHMRACCLSMLQYISYTSSSFGLTFYMLGNFSMIFLLSVDIFSKLNFSKISFRNTIRVSDRLDPDQAQHSVGPDLGPNCLRRTSADDNI